MKTSSLFNLTAGYRGSSIFKTFGKVRLKKIKKIPLKEFGFMISDMLNFPSI